MRIALVADLHGNLPATLALARDLQKQQIDRVFCLGDIVGKGPSSDRTFDWAVANCELILKGNWDIGIARRLFHADEPYYEQLGDERMAQLDAFPLEHEMWLSGRRIRLFHGRPIMPDLVVAQCPKEELEPYFHAPDGGRYDVVCYADAHRQALRTLSPGLWVNIGSVGNAMGIPRCCYAIIEAEEGRAPADFEVRFRQLEYDRQQAIRDAEASDIPRIDTYINEINTGVYSRGG